MSKVVVYWKPLGIKPSVVVVSDGNGDVVPVLKVVVVVVVAAIRKTCEACRNSHGKWNDTHIQAAYLMLRQSQLCIERGYTNLRSRVQKGYSDGFSDGFSMHRHFG
ncbi:hypothetical protein DPMN_151077 [Dreissena polymorpha]|uniref:Uncharacterized protein n=1 Tax=Dreissena polymorpha TaxID=45954 RepID=A0A9D4J2M6_DREPO|nr:hypothetical protein DPMN_151077 [Dreissena polymorpha]